MSTLYLPAAPELSFVRGSKAASQSICRTAGAYTASLQLSEASDEPVTVDIIPSGDALRGVDYELIHRTITMRGGTTETQVGIVMLQHETFRTLRYVDLVVKPRDSKAVKGDFSKWRFYLHSLVEPPTITYTNEIAAEAGTTDVFTLSFELSAPSRETTVVALDASDGTLSYPTGFLVDGDYWNSSDAVMEIPPGVTTAALDISFRGIAGSFRSHIDVPDDNVRRNMLNFSQLGQPETGIRTGTEGTQNGANADKDDVDYYLGVPTDLYFGCDNPYGALGYWSLIHKRSSSVFAPDGSFANFYAVNDEGSGSTLFGCIRKSYATGSVGGWDYSGQSGANDAPLQEGFNILSVYLRNNVTEASFTQAGYSALNLYNRSVALGDSEDPNPADHQIRLQWTAGVPAIISESGVITDSGVESVGSGWYRVWLIYNAPAAAEGDILNWFITPCWHPSDGADLHHREGAYAWGVQFEYDPTRTATGPTEYQPVESMCWYAGTSTKGDQTLTVVSVA